MSTTLNLSFSASAKVDRDSPNQVITFTGASQYALQSNPLLFKAPVVADAYKYRKILSVTVTQQGFLTAGTLDTLNIASLAEEFDATSVTWNTKPRANAAQSRYVNGTGGAKSYYFAMDYNAVRYGVQAYCDDGNFLLYTTKSSSQYVPKAEVELSDDDVSVIVSVYPATGYVNPRVANTLQWSLTPDGESAEPLEQVSAIINWKSTDESNWHFLNADAQDRSVTIPANTFPTSSTIDWYVMVELSNETWVYSNYGQITTTESVSTAICTSPVDEVVDGSNGVTFKWFHSVSSGSEPTGADIQVSYDSGSTWTDLASVTGSATQYHAPKGAVTSGTLQWRVRTYNQDGVAGSWSAPAEFVLVAQPATPSLTATNTPKPVATWDSSEQRAFQIQMGSYDSGLVFGTETTFKCPVYLPDGQTTIRVRVMNAYNLWSDWAVWTSNIQNVPGSSMPTLTVDASTDAGLSWTAVSGAETYLIYRNGEQIAETRSLAYTDRWAIGQTDYMVRAALSGDNYADSYTVTVTLTVKYPLISALDGDWIQLMYTIEPVVETSQTSLRSVSMMQYSGTEFPEPEVAIYRERVYQISSAFKHGKSGAFEALLGRECVLKDQYGNLIHGVISTISKSQNRFYTFCSAEIQQTEGSV